MIITIGSTQKKAVVVGDEIKIRNVIDVTLTLDHRYTDGARAAPLYQKFVNILKDPEKFIESSDAEKRLPVTEVQ